MRGSTRRALGAIVTVNAACAAALAVHAQQNLSFEQLEAGRAAPLGWSMPAEGQARGYRSELDSVSARVGERSLRIEHLGGAQLARAIQRVPVASLAAGDRAANRVRLTGYVRTQGVAEGDAALWLRVDGPGGFIAVDSRSPGVRAADDSAGWTRYEVQAPLPDDAREVAFGAMLRGGGTAWFDDLAIDAFDARSLPPPSATARRYIDAALQIMHEHSINRTAIDWPAFNAATLDQAHGAATASDAHLALRLALRNLGDRHSYLMTPQTAASLRVAPVSNARTGRKPVEPLGELLEGGFGYVAIPGFAGGTPLNQVRFADGLQQLIKDLDSSGTCGWILDLRENTGGNLWPMLAGIGPLLHEGEVGASVYPDDKKVPVWYRDGKAGFGDYVQLRVSGTPYRVAAPDAPVALLIGSSTASSGEVLVMAFRGRSRTLSFGAPTRGLSTGNRTFPLSDGAALVLTVAATSDRAGRVYSGSIDPERLVAQGERAPTARFAGDDAVVAAALAWLTEQATGCDSASR